MSACISRHGEYSDHEPGDWCPRCGAFNEDAIVAERDRLADEVEALREKLARVEALADDYQHLSPGGFHGADAARELRDALTD